MRGVGRPRASGHEGGANVVLLDLLIASLLSVLLFLGLFALADQVVQANTVASRLAVARSQLLSLEADWRLSAAVTIPEDIGVLRCEHPPPWLEAWCQQWSAIAREWREASTLCLSRERAAWHARIRLGTDRCEGAADYEAEHQWPLG